MAGPAGAGRHAPGARARSAERVARAADGDAARRPVAEVWSDLSRVVFHGASPDALEAPRERKPDRDGGRLRRFLFKKVPRVARTIYEADRLTEERVVAEAAGDVLGVQVGLTLSQIDTVKPRGKRELIHVVNLDGSANLEFVAHRMPIGHGQRIELQGPAANGGEAFGARLAGVALTSDLLSGRAPEGLSYTLEAKITDRSILRWAELFGPLVLDRIAASLDSGGGVASALSASVPIVSAGLAALSIRRAVRVWRSDATGLTKALAIGHALADTVRVVDPVIGTIANVALVAVSIGVTTRQLMRLKDEARKSQEQRERFERIEAEPHWQRDPVEEHGSP